MAVAGILGQELLGVPVKWYEAGAAEYDLPVIAQVPILFLVMGFLETKRFQGFKETGTVSACFSRACFCIRWPECGRAHLKTAFNENAVTPASKQWLVTAANCILLRSGIGM